jgi:predicted RNA-binding protein with RPS1 domain
MDYQARIISIEERNQRIKASIEELEERKQKLRQAQEQIMNRTPRDTWHLWSR